MKDSRFSWLLLCVALMVIGCEGPEGPAGPTGPTGPAGTANVIYSGWYSPETWVAQTTFGIAERVYTMTTDALTQEIIDNGVVLVYMRFVGFNPQINQLPVFLADVSYSFLFRAQAGSIEVVYYRTTSPTTDPGVIPSANQVRYVLIPGGVLDEVAASAGITYSRLVDSLGSKSYAEVCGLLDIPE